jgi:hypothetical protein
VKPLGLPRGGLMGKVGFGSDFRLATLKYLQVIKRGGPIVMKPEEELVLKVTKEIVIKYIEIGRLPLTSFDEAFRTIHKTVQETIQPEKS